MPKNPECFLGAPVLAEDWEKNPHPIDFQVQKAIKSVGQECPTHTLNVNGGGRGRPPHAVEITASLVTKGGVP